MAASHLGQWARPGQQFVSGWAANVAGHRVLTFTGENMTNGDGLVVWHDINRGTWRTYRTKTATGPIRIAAQGPTGYLTLRAKNGTAASLAIATSTLTPAGLFTLER